VLYLVEIFMALIKFMIFTDVFTGISQSTDRNFNTILPYILFLQSEQGFRHAIGRHREV
jgi:hypothetical protein